MSDYELQLKIRNAPLLAMMRANGYPTAAALSRASGVNKQTIGDLLAIKKPLYRKIRKGDGYFIYPSVERLARFFCCTPEELYPQAHWYDKLEQDRFSATVSRETMEFLTHKSTGDPAVFLEYLEGDAQLDIEEMIEGAELTRQERNVLMGRFRDGKTLQNIAEKFNANRERVRQIEARALRKLRRPKVSEKLRKYWEPEHA